MQLSRVIANSFVRMIWFFVCIYWKKEKERKKTNEEKLNHKLKTIWLK